MINKIYSSIKKELKRQAGDIAKDSNRRNSWIDKQIKYGVSGFKSTTRRVRRKIKK